MGTKVRDVMTDRPRCVTLETPISEVAQLMESEDIGSLPVLEGDQLAGMITDRDIVVRAIAEGSLPSEARVGDFATWDIVCARPESSVDEAMEVMADCQIGRLPVVDSDNRVIGIVTLSSLALRSRKQGDALETAQQVSKRSARIAVGSG